MFQVLSALPDQDSFYDVVDRLEEQNMEKTIQRHLTRKGATDIDLVEQLQIYESVLKQEDDGTSTANNHARLINNYNFLFHFLALH